MAAGIAALSILAQPGFYEKLEQTTQAFVEELRSFIAERGYQIKIFSIGSIFWFAFTEQEKIQRADQIDPASMEFYKKMHRELLNRGIYFGPSGYEVGFISAAHTEDDLKQTLAKIKESLDIVFQ